MRLGPSIRLNKSELDRIGVLGAVGIASDSSTDAFELKVDGSRQYAPATFALAYRHTSTDGAMSQRFHEVAVDQDGQAWALGEWNNRADGQQWTALTETQLDYFDLALRQAQSLVRLGMDNTVNLRPSDMGITF